LNKNSDLTQDKEKPTVEEISASSVDKIVPDIEHVSNDMAEQQSSSAGGQDKKKKADNKSTGLTGHGTGLTGAPSKSGNSSKIKTRPSFKELLAKYEKEGSAQRQKGRPSEIKDTGSSSRHQEQSSQGNYTSSSGPIAPWYCWYPYFYTPMDYSRMHMQSFYIQYPPLYPNHALLQRPIIVSNNPVKQDVDCSKENEKSKEQDSKYL